MKAIIVEPAADDDLINILAFIAIDSQSNADRVVDRIDAKLRLLAEMPRAGRPRPELGEGVRSVVAFRFVVFYRVDPHAVRILRVLHGSQDVTGSDF